MITRDPYGRTCDPVLSQVKIHSHSSLIYNLEIKIDLLVVVPGDVLLHVALDEAVEPVALAHVTHELHGGRFN